MILIDPFTFPRSKCYDVRVIDGDTIACNVVHSTLKSIDGDQEIVLKSTIRLIRIDAPEKRTSAGTLLKMFLTKLLATASKIEVEGVKKDIYGRVLGEMYVTSPLLAEGAHGDDRVIGPINLSDWFLSYGVVMSADKRVQRTASEEMIEEKNIQRLFNKYHLL